MTRIGIFGTQADPFHLGHLATCRAARDELDLDLVLVTVCADPAHRPPSARLADERYAITAAALAEEPGIDACDIELSLPRPSLTYRTVAALADRHAGAEFSVILGADQIAALETWEGVRALRASARIIGVPRTGVLAGADGADAWISATPIATSSTEIRARIAAGMPIDELVPAASLDLVVARYRDAA